MITKELNNKTKVIIMGDFNATLNPISDRSSSISSNRSWKPEAGIFDFLTDWAFTDIHSTWEEEIPSPTWSNKCSYSRIDYIWISSEIALNNIFFFYNEKAEKIVNSDHTLLSLKLYRNNLIDNTCHKPIRKQGKTKLIDIKNTTPEQWNKFSEKVDHKLSKTDIKEITNNLLNKLTNNDNNSSKTEVATTEKTLNYIWNTFEKCLITTAFSTLKIVRIKNYGYKNTKDITHPPEFKKYRKSLILLKAFNKTIETKDDNHLKYLNQIVQNFNKENPTIWSIRICENINKLEATDWNSWKKEMR